VGPSGCRGEGVQKRDYYKVQNNCQKSLFYFYYERKGNIHWNVRVWRGIRKGAESATNVLCHAVTLALSREMESESEKLKANGMQCRALLEEAAN
jgi:hypothetical protein